MNLFQRLVAASGLASLALVAPVLADTLPGGAHVNATGGYLAGQQAITELRTPDAARFFGDALAGQGDNPLVLEQAFIAEAADGQIDTAVDTARRLLDVYPTDAMAQLVMATQALKQRRYDAAIHILDNLGMDSLEGMTGAVLRAWALTGAGRVDDAFKSLDSVSSTDEFLIFNRAIMADVAGRTPDAVDDITKAHDADPYSADVVEAYARILGNAGRFKDAIDAIVTFEAQGLTHPMVSQVKQAVIGQQRPGLFADSVQAGAANMFRSLGVALARDNTADAALVMMRLAGYLDPRNDGVSLAIGQLYDSAGRHELANALYDAIPATSPMKPLATVQEAGNLDAMGNRKEAIHRLSDIVAATPTDINAVGVLGDLLRADKQYQAAADTYSKALAITGGNAPGDWYYYYARGIAYEQGDQFPLAEKDFLKAISLNPNDAELLNYLGYSWVDKGMNLDKALAMIQKAVKLAPKDGYTIDSLGWAYFRLGRYDDAVAELESAATLLPNDPQINDHLGDAYWREGRKLEAHFQWNVAYSLDTTGTLKKLVAPKLKDGLPGLPAAPAASPVAAVSPPAASADQVTTN